VFFLDLGALRGSSGRDNQRHGHGRGNENGKRQKPDCKFCHSLLPMPLQSTVVFWLIHTARLGTFPRQAD